MIVAHIWIANLKTCKRVCSLRALYMANSACIFRKSPLMLIVVGQFHLNNLNNKENESQVRGNTREGKQTSRFAIHVL